MQASLTCLYEQFLSRACTIHTDWHRGHMAGWLKAITIIPSCCNGLSQTASRGANLLIKHFIYFTVGVLPLIIMEG